MNMIKTLALVSALFAAQSAMATTYDLGLVGQPGSKSQAVSVTGVGWNSNDFTFSIANNGTASGSAPNVYTGINCTTSCVGSDSVTISLFDSTGKNLFTGKSGLPITTDTFSFGTLAAGSYKVTVLSWVWKTGTYQFTLGTGAPATAVPENDAYAMMLAGLGLVGFAARRKLKA